MLVPVTKIQPGDVVIAKDGKPRTVEATGKGWHRWLVFLDFTDNAWCCYRTDETIECEERGESQ